MTRKVAWVLSTLVFLALTAPGFVPGQDEKELPAWEPAEEQLEQLAGESKFDDWAVRPPLDFPHKIAKKPKETITTWGKEAEGFVSVIQANIAAGDDVTLERAFDAYVATLKARFQNFKQNPSDYGRINGKKFIRVRFSAEGFPGISGRGYGFIYTTFDGKTPIAFAGYGTATTIKTMEASVLTFRILK